MTFLSSSCSPTHHKHDGPFLPSHDIVNSVNRNHGVKIGKSSREFLHLEKMVITRVKNPEGMVEQVDPYLEALQPSL